MANNNSIVIPPRVKDLTGQVFGRLTVLWYVGNNKHGCAMWRCACQCGDCTTVLGSSLRSGHAKSCGCFNRDMVVAANTRHGKHATLEYRSWRSMINRCHNPADQAYSRYGGRSIIVCQRWRESLEAFIADMGSRPLSSHSIDRIDNDKGYSKNNCRWATPQEQSRNRRRHRLVTFDGKTMCVTEWSEATGIPAATLYWRLGNGWSVERALAAPVKHATSPSRSG